MTRKKDICGVIFVSLLLTAFLSFEIPNNETNLSSEELEIIKEEITLEEKEEIEISYLPSIDYKKDYKHYEKLISAIAQVESEGNPLADSKKGDVGLLQQRKISVDEANRLLGENVFKYEDRKNPKLTVKMFLIIQKHHNPSGDYQLAARIWNNFDKKMINPKTKTYWNKVKKELWKGDKMIDHSILWKSC